MSLDTNDIYANTFIMEGMDENRTTDLIERILEVTKSEQSVPFYLKAIKVLGAGLVESEFSNLRHYIRTSNVRSPGSYFTTLLKKQMDRPGADSADPNGLAIKQDPSANTPTHFTENSLELFNELLPRKITKKDEFLEEALNPPFSEKYIQWATFIGPEFFRLSTYAPRGDEVIAKFRTLDGGITHVPMIRGSYFPGGKQFGILTAAHGKVLGALENFWVEQGCPYTTYRRGGVRCYCTVQIRDLARTLGRKSTRNMLGRDGLKYFTNLVIDLRVIPYYIRLDSLEEFRLSKIKGFGFTLLDETTVLDKRSPDSKVKETLIRVTFSDTYSRQLLGRRVVTRSKDLLTHRNELGFLIRLYLEPILMGKEPGQDHAVNLEHLIKLLNLSPAKWHQYKSQRKVVFSRVLNDLNDKRTIDGRRLTVSIEEGLKDYMLRAFLA